MRESTRKIFYYSASLMTIVLAASCIQGDLYNSGVNNKSEDSAISWDSPKMRNIAKELDSICEAHPEKIPGDDGKSKNWNLSNMIEQLYKIRLTEQEIRQLAAKCDAVPVNVDEGGEGSGALKFIIKHLINYGERERLVELLAKRCPNLLGFGDTIEFYLVCYGNRLKDPILILGEAYSKCKIPEIKHKLAAAVRRGFADIGISGRTDAEYVNNAMQWYKNNKDHLEFNYEYSTNESFSLGYTVEDYEKHPERYDVPIKGIRREPLLKKIPHSEMKKRFVEKNVQEPNEMRKRNTDAPITLDQNDRSVKNELAQLKGTWEIYKIRDNGKDVPQKKYQSRRIEIEGDKKYIYAQDGKSDEKEIIRIDPKQTPKAMDNIKVFKDETKILRSSSSAVDRLIDELYEATLKSMEIYELRGDTLKICGVAYRGWRRPISFKAAKDSGDYLIVYKRVPSSKKSLIIPAGVVILLVAIAIAFRLAKRCREPACRQ